jgi:PIN domain nuclease of toxin-antitoxin system
MARAVFDASAVIALLRDEPGAEVVAGYAGEALISAVNLQEVIKVLLADGVSEGVAREMLAPLGLDVRSHGLDEAWAAAGLYAVTKSRGSGLGDRSCMALAIAEGLPALTTDRAWNELAIAGLSVVLAR